MGRLTGKVAIITGAASGMGLTEAQLFSKEGAKVVATDIVFETLQERVNDIIANGGEAIALKLDVSSSEEWQEVISQTIKKYGKIDVLVNNAGIHCGKNLLEAGLEEWDKVMAINGKGVFLGMKAVVPEMMKNGQGSIINISSLAGLVGGHFADGGDASYSASKGAVRSITKHAAQLLAKDKIRVNSVHPGGIKTPMSEEVLRANPQYSEKLQEYAPLPPHLADPIDIAYGVLYLSSDESRYVTGIELIIDGGFISR